MGRSLKRVPLDFKWPLEKPWDGFINPYSNLSTTCLHCQGSGFSPFAQHLKDKWHGQAPFHPSERGSTPFLPDHPLVLARAQQNVNGNPSFFGFGERALKKEAQRLSDLYNSGWHHHLNVDDVAALIAGDRLWDFTRTWTPEGRKPKNPPYVPTPQEVNEWSLSGWGHDDLSKFLCIQAECLRLNKDLYCPHSGSSGEIWPSPEIKAAYDEWQPSEPPAGDGYQMWETVSNGSPISPVFSTPEALSSWLAEHKYGADDEHCTAESWLDFINNYGSGPSFMSETLSTTTERTIR